MILQDAIDGYLLFKASGASAETLKTDAVLFRQFAAWAAHELIGSVEEVRSEHIIAYLDHQRARGLAPSTVRRHYAVLSALWTWLTSPDIALATRHVVSSVPIPKTTKRVVRALSQDELTALLVATTTTEQPRRDRALVLFMLDSCARVSEVAGLERAHIDLKTARVRVLGKGDKERYTYLGKRTLQAIWLYIRQERPNSAQPDRDPLFMAAGGYPLDRDSIRKIVMRLSNKAGVRCYPHLFRHTGAVLRLRAGMDLLSLQRLLGHEKLETTQIYLSGLTDEDVAAAAGRTSPGDNWRL